MSGDFAIDQPAASPQVDAATAPDTTASGPSIREAATAAINSAQDAPASDNSGVRDALNSAMREKVATPQVAQWPAAKTPTAETSHAAPALTGDRHLDEIHTFHGAKDASGSPAHPHFDAVLETILQLARAERDGGRLPTLAALYDQAIWMNPQIRAGLIEKHTAPPRAPVPQAPARQAAPTSIRGALRQAMAAGR